MEVLHLAGVAGSNEQEKTIAEMVNDGVEDLRLKYYMFLFKENVRMSH